MKNENCAAYDLYAIDFSDIQFARERIEKILDIRLAAHESGYHCGEYFRYRDVGSEHYILQQNYDAFSAEWTEDDYSNFALLFYVNESQQSEELQNLLLKEPGFCLLRHQIL